MILTCPECATSYFVEQARIPAEGRKVRCSTCGHRWIAGPDGQVMAPPAAAESLQEPEAQEAAAADAPSDMPDLVAVEPEPAPFVAPLTPVKPATRGRSETPGSRLLAWAGAAALAAALVAAAVVFREQVVSRWPGSASAYAGLGLKLAGDGLVLEGVQARPAFLAGRPVLTVIGSIRNPRGVAIDSPPVRVTLLDRRGQPVAAKIARPAEASIPARARRHFAITLLDPPAAAEDLEVRFEGGGGRPAKASAHATPAAAAPEASAVPAVPAPETPALTPAAAAEHG